MPRRAVKTLHPAIHAGILAMRGNPEHMDKLKELSIDTIDVVCINLYPFKKTMLKEGVELEEAIENIDIGGPTMIRAAAKNYQDVVVVVDPRDYDMVLDSLKKGEMTKEKKFTLAAKVFAHTANYDAMIANYVGKIAGFGFGDTVTYTYEKVQDMRYGENPHQKAAFYKEISNRKNTLAQAEQFWGKELSYNNINDASGALDVIKEFPDVPCAVAVKHANPCGVGVGEDIAAAYKNAYDADPVSIFGGIIALNRKCTAACAAEIAKIFCEIVIAPTYEAEALEILKAKKNLRILILPGMMTPNTKDMLDMKKVAGGF